MSLVRGQYIEQIRRQIYGGFPPEDAEITVPLVNLWLDQAIAYAAQQNYRDNLKLDGVAYINNGFYTKFKDLSVSKDEDSVWKIDLPQVPAGIGTSEGVSTLTFKDADLNQVSFPVVWLSTNQLGFHRGMRVIPNKVLAYQQGGSVYVMTPIVLSQYTAHVTMISGGNSSNLDSVLNVPADYLPLVTRYLKEELMFERSVPVDEKSDGIGMVSSAPK